MNFRRNTKALCLGLTVTAGLMTASAAQATEGYFALGYGANQRAVGGAGVAHAFEAMSAAVNPAAAAHVGHEMQLGVELFSPRRGYTGTGTVFVPSGVVDSGSEYFWIPSFAYNRPLANGAVLNFAVYGNGGMNTDFGTGLAGCGSVFCGGPAGVDLSQLFVSVTYAQKAGNLSWGIAPTLVAQRFKAEGLGAFSGISVNAGALTDNGYDWSVGGGLRAGLQWSVNDDFSLGVSGQTKMKMSEFDRYAGLFEDGGSFDIPASLTLGAAWKAGADVTMMADYQRIFYSGVPAISNAGNAGPLGAPGGAGFGWDDVDVVKLGVEWKKSDQMTWRAGYAYATNPVGGEDVTLNIIAPGIVEHHFSVGGSYRLNDRDRLDFSAVYVPQSTVSGAETTPGGPTPGVVELNMHQFSISVGWTRTF